MAVAFLLMPDSQSVCFYEIFLPPLASQLILHGIRSTNSVTLEPQAIILFTWAHIEDKIVTILGKLDISPPQIYVLFCQTLLQQTFTHFFNSDLISSPFM